MYIKTFTLPLGKTRIILEEASEICPEFQSIYPCELFEEKDLSEIQFGRITIFYGGNGSGKSTLLNLIASRLELNRVSPFNKSEIFDLYASRCTYTMGYDEEGFRYRVPNGSRIITSDDIFDYMLTVRTNNQDVFEQKAEAKEEYREYRYGGPLRFQGMDQYEEFCKQVQAQKKSMSRRKYIRQMAGDEVKLRSNGETALRYFEIKLRQDTLYCLDEPENSLSPELQIKLTEMLEQMARYCGCQFIIATHSPFILSMKDARIYDLDSKPTVVRDWWELDNTRVYFDFFYKHKDKFL